MDSSTSTAQWGVTKSSAQDEAEPALEGPKGEDGGGGGYTQGTYLEEEEEEEIPTAYEKRN